MNIKLNNIIYTVVPECKNDYMEARKVFKRHLEDVEEDLEACKSYIHRILADSKSLIRDYNPNTFKVNTKLVDYLSGEKKKRDVVANTANKKSSFYWAIILTSIIAQKDDNRIEFIALYRICFDILALYFDPSLRNNQILKLYPDDVNRARDQWLQFLGGEMYEGELYASFYVILCMVVYLSINCLKRSPETRTRVGTKCHALITQLITQAELTDVEKMNRANYLKEHLDWIENALGKTKLNANHLLTTFTRKMDVATGAFPMPEHYIERSYFMDDLLTTAFSNSQTLFLTGDRGIGKSLFAKNYALLCAKGNNIRKECQYEHIIYTTYDSVENREQKDIENNTDIANIEAEDSIVKSSTLGLHSTISSLSCSENIVGDLFTTKIAMMKELSQAGKRPCLLVVDNFDFENTESLLNELKSDAFSDLIKTGWHILFTTKNNMGKITLSSIREKTLPPLSLSELKTLFHNTLNNSNSKLEDDKLTILIETYLKNNTYLVSLAAGLCDTLLEVNCETLDDALDYIIQAFKKLNVSGVGGSFSGEKDGNKQTFMEHYKTMFTLSNIQDDKDKMRFLYNLACVPISGVNRISFFKDAFLEEEREKMRNTCNELISSRWVIYEKENNVLSLHPMVREIIKESAMPVDFVTRYICVLNKKSRYAEFSSTLRNIELLKATYQILDDRNWKGESKEAFFNYCCLVSLISCHFDTLHGFKKEAYVFGCRAIELLDQYVSQYGSLCDMEKIALAESYNDCGYAILHYIPFQKKQGHHDEAKKTFEIAYENIKKAEKIVGKSDVSLLNEETDFKLALVQTSVQGNLAACHYAQGEHPEGVAIHKRELAYRQKLSIVFALDKDRQQKIRTILGNSHKGIATGLFHIGRKHNDFAKLYHSYYHHQEARKFYDVEQVNHSLLITQVRMMGAVVELMKNHFKEFSKKEDVGKLLEDSFKQYLSAAQFYSKLKFSVPDECEEWIKRTLAFGNLVQLYQDRINCFDITGMIQQIYTLYYNNDKTRELVKKHNINGVIHDLKKRKENKVDGKNIMSTM